MSTTPLWRSADPHDEPFLREVWARTHGSQFAVLPPEVQAQLCRHQYDAQLADYRHNYPGLEDLVLRWRGFDAGRLLLHEQPERVRVLDLIVLPEHQGQGVASRVLRRVQELAAARPVGLAVRLDHGPTITLYEGLGFEPVGEPTATHLFMEWRRP